MGLLTGEVVLIRVSFHQGTGGKVRPAVVVLDTGDDDFLAAPITSQRRASVYETALEDWRSAGLNVASFVRVHKLSVLAKADVIRRIGQLSEGDRTVFEALVCKSFCRSETGQDLLNQPKGNDV
jgi:mRNA interferase MazF